MIPLFTGYDRREAAGLTVFRQSVIDHCRRPWPMVALHGDQRDGTNAFTYARFGVPFLCNRFGRAVFVDGVDMMLRADIDELLLGLQPGKAVHVVKHQYRTKHPRKYRGTEMEAENPDYPRKNWSSVVVWECDHPANWCLTPEYIEEHHGSHLHRFGWLPDNLIGTLPPEWNWMPDEYGFNAGAKLVHWTAGIPGFTAYRDAPFADEWRDTMGRALGGLQSHLLVDAGSLKISQR